MLKLQRSRQLLRRWSRKHWGEAQAVWVHNTVKDNNDFVNGIVQSPRFAGWQQYRPVSAYSM